MLIAFDIATIALTLLAAYLWFQSSRGRHRRISHREELTAHDLNRMIVVLNRSQIANQRAALATAASALSLALRLGLDMWLRIA